MLTLKTIMLSALTQDLSTVVKTTATPIEIAFVVIDTVVLKQSFKKEKACFGWQVQGD